MFITNEEALVRLKEAGSVLTMARGNFLNLLQMKKTVTKAQVFSYFNSNYPNVTRRTILNTLETFEEARIITLLKEKENMVIRLRSKEKNSPVCLCSTCGKKTILVSSVIALIKNELDIQAFTIHSECKKCKRSAV
jgi:Fe2+ or Zn2+ uptake regulation protein